MIKTLLLFNDTSLLSITSLLSLSSPLSMQTRLRASLGLWLGPGQRFHLESKVVSCRRLGAAQLWQKGTVFLKASICIFGHELPVAYTYIRDNIKNI